MFSPKTNTNTNTTTNNQTETPLDTVRRLREEYKNTQHGPSSAPSPKAACLRSEETTKYILNQTPTHARCIDEPETASRLRMGVCKTGCCYHCNEPECLNKTKRKYRDSDGNPTEEHYYLYGTCRAVNQMAKEATKYATRDQHNPSRGREG